ncbi:MAG TPA: hypothetical protein VMV92_05855 [Streptosporangiaceae bacterium]|nr:hypothetical protein [Streptosporangiaceae bacterium]
MTPVTVNYVDAAQPDDMAPPPGHAIVRPLRHVRAVRERHAQRYADPSEAAVSRSARAWAWALGECTTAPVTDRETAVPPSRADIEAEIATAEERRLRGDRENRADAAATILRWLIGNDDRVPVRCDNPGELVGGFGDVVRPRQQISKTLAAALQGQRRAAAMTRNIDVDPDDRQFARQDADYLDGVVTTLAWVLGQRPEAPITRRQSRELTTTDLKAERLHAEDVINQARSPGMVGPLPPPPPHGEGVKFTITWLLGDWTTPPVDPTGDGPYAQGSHLPAMIRDAQVR